VEAQIEREIHQDINAMGEDPYHSGGAAHEGANEVHGAHEGGNEVHANEVHEAHEGTTTVAAVGGAPIVDTQYTGIHLDEQGNLSDIDFQRKVKEILTENGIKFLPNVELVTYKSLPDTKNEFAEIFVDMDTLNVRRPDVLKKRILGLTSYFRSAQESLLPSFVMSDGANDMNPQYHIEYVEMSDQQFIDYAKLDYQKIIPIVRKYFSPSKQINDIVKNLEHKYTLDYDNICVLFYRGNDKITEINLSQLDFYYSGIFLFEKSFFGFT
jgi:hypothetical protein